MMSLFHSQKPKKATSVVVYHHVTQKVTWSGYLMRIMKDYRSIYLYIYALLVVYLLTLGDLARLGQAKRKVFHEEGALSVQDI